MKIKVSDYIANFLVEKGITDIFTVVGGGAMHLNDSFGHNPKLNCIYNHHEQASSMAAESYARVSGKPAIVCVTSGPGAINTLNGVAGAYQDSVPMIVVSGQTKTSLLVKNSGLNLRTLGNQEFDIVSSISQMTKYAQTIMDANKIKYCLEKAYHIATTGRQGPCWLDIPIDIQGSVIDTDNLESYEAEIEPCIHSDLTNELKIICQKLKTAKRPVFYAGNGIRLSGGIEIFKELIANYKIPVVTCWDSIDLIDTENECYCGRAGIMGDRAGNFAVQNSDFLICVGTRLNVYQVGYNIKAWARAAYVVAVDIDSEELKKPTVRIDLPVCCDAKYFMQSMLDSNFDFKCNIDWINQCIDWKAKYPVVTLAQKRVRGLVNVYSFFDTISRTLHQKSITVVTNGSASVVGSASYYIKNDDRFIMNCAISSMGYGLPAAIGACVAHGRRQVICFEGDGSIMMNLQELQTVVTNRLPIKLFLINNNGYHQIRQTQNNIFHNGLVGVGPDSGDLGFPNFEILAGAFGIPYFKIDDNQNQLPIIQKVLNTESFVLCEVFVSLDQNFEPKSATKKLDDGTLFSSPLEDLAPFLPREELKENMYIPLIG